MNDYQDRYQLMQRLQPGYGVEPKGTNIALLMVILAVGIICMTVALEACRNEPQPSSAAMKECSECHRRMAMVEYFKKAKHPTPQQLAEAVLNPKVKSPRLMAAIAATEKTPPHIRKGGYKGRHAGSYQMNERLHKKKYGPVPTDPLGQTIQAEKYLSDLTQEYPIKKALSIYGGDSTDAYQKRVLAELQTNVP